ncbi:piggyBac transposable element-derived protein 4-like [Rana temporaria]|uniref:piggyBac transposable element-derived protein 4-like n=1 Tax=Rana temporaria TaxID=8407 RepID=UPI001AADB908|nr:piggyBac transposable element-derived protein 4-like [Rana temporaria]
MSKQTYTSKEAFQVLTLTDESSGELSSSDSDYEPVEGSESITESEEEMISTKRMRSSEEETTTSTIHYPTEEASSTVHLNEKAHTSLPEARANPLWLPSDSGSASIPPFTAQPGIQANTENFTPIDFFNLFFTDDLFHLIVDQSNLFAQQYIANKPNSNYAAPFEWTPVTVEEFKKFLGLTLNAGLSQMNDVQSCWSTSPIFHKPLYSSVMSMKRYEMIMRFLHFSDNTLCPPRNRPGYDKLFKIRPLINIFSQKFAQLYIPEKHICVDESLIHFTGRLGLEQSTPNKRDRYGVKLHKLCERATGYTYAFRVYEGDDSQLEPPDCPSYMGNSGKIVLDLALPLFQKGYHLYVGEFYTSVPLFHHLYQQKTLACGIVRASRGGLPQRLVTTRLQRGESMSLRNNEVLALKWRNKKNVYVLSSIHNDTSVEYQGRHGPIQVPECMYDYNDFMGGVDFNDKTLQPFLATKMSSHWYKKVSIYLFQLAIYNSYVLYRKSTERPASFLTFERDIITALIYQGGPVPDIIQTDVVSRLHGRHFPSDIPPTETGQQGQKKCKVCSENGVSCDTPIHCTQCPSQPGLCIESCFKRYHTLVRY